MWLPLLGLDVVLTILMLIDCVQNRRDVMWIFVLLLLGPIGALVYIGYNYRSITFPFSLARGISWGGWRRQALPALWPQRQSAHTL